MDITSLSSISEGISQALHLTVSDAGNNLETSDMSGNMNMETHEQAPSLPRPPLALDELDPRVQAAILEGINQQIEVQVRASLAAMPPTTMQVPGTYPSVRPTTGHAAGSQSDRCTDGRPPRWDTQI